MGAGLHAPEQGRRERGRLPATELIEADPQGSGVFRECPISV
jgi:hypothetical protein